MSHQAEIEVRHPRSTSTYTPTTFVERGLAVPFTTPLLGGARVRPGEREAPELLVANPTGGRGAYVVPWAGIPAICSPTLHDRVLFERLCAVAALTPETVRRAALDVARQGLAGRAAAAAATAAASMQAALSAATRHVLLRLLIEQTTASAASALSPAEQETAEQRAIVTAAGRLGRSPETFATRLDSLAAALAPLGVGEAAPKARLPALLRALAEMPAAVRAALDAPPDYVNADAELVLQATESAASAARQVQGALLDSLLDLPALLRAWLRDPEAVRVRALRPDWLLDGWDRICLLWQDEPRRDDRLFAEMADLVPAVPREAGEWVAGLAERTAGIMRGRRGQAEAAQDWRDGPLVADRIARNERLQTRALAG